MQSVIMPMKLFKHTCIYINIPGDNVLPAVLVGVSDTFLLFPVFLLPFDSSLCSSPESENSSLGMTTLSLSCESCVYEEDA